MSGKDTFRLFAGSNFEELMSYLTSVHSNMPLSNILCKTKNFQIANHKCLICVILGCKFEKLLPYLKSAPSSLSKYQKQGKTTTTITATAKMEPKMPYLGSSARIFEKLVLYLKSISSNLAKCKILIECK